MTVDEAKNVIRKLDRELDDTTPAFRVAVVLLLSAEYGPKPDRLAQITGYSRAEIRAWAYRLRRSGVWSSKKVHADWSDEKTGGIAFWCDVNVGLGILKRAGR